MGTSLFLKLCILLNFLVSPALGNYTCQQTGEGLHCVVDDLDLVDLPHQVTHLTINMHNVSLNNSLFPKLGNLSWLEIQTTKFEVFGEDCFKNTPNLEKLIITNAERQPQNPEDKISENASEPTLLSGNIFGGTTNLKSVTIQNLPLRLVQGSMKYLMNLKTLVLQNTGLSSPPTGGFDAMHTLHKLDLSNNHIASLSFLVNTSLPYLNAFNLSYNSMENFNIQSDVLPNISVLDLSGNHLKIVDGNTFSSLQNVKILFLKENPVHFIDPDIFSNMQISHLDLSHTNLTCACDQHSLFSWILRQKNLTLSNFQNTKCYETGAIQSVQISDFLQECAAKLAQASNASVTKSNSEWAGTTQTSANQNGINQSLANQTEANITAWNRHNHVSDTARIAITVGVICLAVLILSITAIFAYCRFRRFSSWSPDREILIEDNQSPQNNRRKQHYKKRPTILDIGNPYDENPEIVSDHQSSSSVSPTEGSTWTPNHSNAQGYVNHGYKIDGYHPGIDIEESIQYREMCAKNKDDTNFTEKVGNEPAAHESISGSVTVHAAQTEDANPGNEAHFMENNAVTTLAPSSSTALKLEDIPMVEIHQSVDH